MTTETQTIYQGIDYDFNAKSLSSRIASGVMSICFLMLSLLFIPEATAHRRQYNGKRQVGLRVWFFANN